MPFRLLAAAALAALLGLLAARPAGAARSDRLVLKLRTGDVAFQEIETNA